MARNFKVGDVVTLQIIGNTNPMKRDRNHAIITRIEDGIIYYKFRNSKEELPISIGFAVSGSLSKSKFQNKLKQKYGWH